MATPTGRLAGIGMTSARTRARMVERLRESGIRDEAVLAAMNAVPRHIFVDEALAIRAYEDVPLPIGHGQTISQPWVVARMTELARNGRTLDSVLEIGTGCGYQTAVLAQLAREVYTVERIGALVAKARRNLQSLKVKNVRLKHGDGSAELGEDLLPREPTARDPGVRRVHERTRGRPVGAEDDDRLVGDDHVTGAGQGLGHGDCPEDVGPLGDVVAVEPTLLLVEPGGHEQRDRSGADDPQRRAGEPPDRERQARAGGDPVRGREQHEVMICEWSHEHEERPGCRHERPQRPRPASVARERERDQAGGTGANFLFNWRIHSPENEPLFDGVMISTSGQQGLSFATKGHRIK
mgnify:CR=1 FL=1